MKPVSKSALEAHFLEYFRQVEETGEELIVTDGDRPVLKVVPIRARKSAVEIFADVRGKVTYHEDFLLQTKEEWSEK